MKTCPYCGESIQEDAAKCRFCKRLLIAQLPAHAHTPPPVPATKRRARKPAEPLPMPSTLIAFDVETTGLSAGSDRIIEIGAVRFTPNGQRLAVFQKLANPGFGIPPSASDVNNISDAMVARAAPTAAVVREFVDWCGPEATFVAHNASFDADFLVVSLSAAGILIPENWQIVDTLTWVRKSDLVTLEDYKLVTLAHALGISDGQHHRALSDASVVVNLTKLLLASDDSQIPFPKRARKLTKLAAKKATNTQRYYLGQIGVPAQLIETADRVAVGRLIAQYDDLSVKRAMVESEKAWRAQGGVLTVNFGMDEVMTEVRSQQKEDKKKQDAKNTCCGCIALIIVLLFVAAVISAL